MLERIGMHWVLRNEEGKIISRTLYRPQVGADVELPLSVRIRDAVLGLDVANDVLWTKQGYPQMSAIEEVVGDTAITRRDVADATGNYRRPVVES